MTIDKDEVLKLAKECGAGCHRDCTGELSYSMYDDELLAFANAIEQKAMEAQKIKLDEYRRSANEWKWQAQEYLSRTPNIVSGALYDFMGWLTSRRTEITLSDHHDAGIAVTTLIDFAKMRGLSTDKPLIDDWNKYSTLIRLSDAPDAIRANKE